MRVNARYINSTRRTSLSWSDGQFVKVKPQKNVVVWCTVCESKTAEKCCGLMDTLWKRNHRKMWQCDVHFVKVKPQKNAVVWWTRAAAEQRHPAACNPLQEGNVKLLSEQGCTINYTQATNPSVAMLADLTGWTECLSVTERAPHHSAGNEKRERCPKASHVLYFLIFAQRHRLSPMRPVARLCHSPTADTARVLLVKFVSHQSVSREVLVATEIPGGRGGGRGGTPPNTTPVTTGMILL